MFWKEWYTWRYGELRRDVAKLKNLVTMKVDYMDWRIGVMEKKIKELEEKLNASKVGKVSKKG